jgi:hypothetical protein
MKKSKIYFIAPLLVLIAFGAYYWNFKSHYDEKIAAQVAADKARKLEKLKQEAINREAAIHDALIAQQKRKEERKEREAKEQKQKDDKENATLNAAKADQESQKLQRQVEKLTKDVETEKEDIKKIEADNKKEVEEVAFLQQFDKVAQENQAAMAAVLTKIGEADAAAAKAAEIAAKNAAKNK